MLSSCANSVNYDDSVDIPPQPSNVRNAGSTVSIPDSALKKMETNQLITLLRQSELRNARAVNSCKAYHKKLQTLYSRKGASLGPVKQRPHAPETGARGGNAPRPSTWWLPVA